MVVYQLIFLILSVVFINSNLLAVSNAFDLENVDQFGSKMMGENNEHVERKMVKREDDIGQGKCLEIFAIEFFFMQ